MSEYRTRLFEMDDCIDLPVADVSARGWSASLRGLTPNGIISGSEEFVTSSSRKHHYKYLLETLEFSKNKLTNRYAPEIVINARNRVSAQKALNLIGAASALLFASPTFDDAVAVPSDYQNPEGLLKHEIEHTLQSSNGTSGFWKATKIAARATMKSTWKFAVAKYLASLKSSSVHPMDHHPHVGSRFDIEKDPVEIVKMAQSISLAYSVIEELGFEVRASQTRPSKIGGKWNPIVLDDLKSRLSRSGLSWDEKFDWMIRGAPKLIEKRQTPPSGTKTAWTRNRVRDRTVNIADAIGYASFLRSKASAHASGTLTKHLTMVDVSNVQDLARQLTLRVLGQSKQDAPLIVI
ncbi:MAG: hypothetical protein U1E93_07055 [Alphaproteobacteria bacterium]